MEKRTRLRLDLVLSGTIMMLGIGMLVIPLLMGSEVPEAWRRTSAAIIICGAVAELMAVRRFIRS